MARRHRTLGLIIAPLPLLAAVAIAANATPSSQPRVVVPGSVSPALAHSHRGDAVGADQQMSVSIPLKLRDAAGLDAFLTQVNDPKSAQYHHYLTPAQFTERFGPSQGDVDKVTDFARSAGLHVDSVSGNRQVVTASGTVGQLEKAFATTLSGYQDSIGNRSFYANDTAPQLPVDLAPIVQGIVGLDNHTVRHRHSVSRPAAAPAGFGPTQLRGAYDTGSLGTGAGQSVALWEFDGYQQANLSGYAKQFGLTPSASTTVSVDGANYDASPGEGQGEVELDIEIVQALAPAVTTYVYEAPNSDQGEIDMANKIATDNKVSVVSISWGACEPDRSPSEMDAVSNGIKQGTAEGISFFAASGDDGSKDCARSQTGATVDAVDYPASDPNVTGVGGTTLKLNGTGYGSETTWSRGGGGTSTHFAVPGYQAGVNGKRTVPDVASDADPATGYSIFSAGAWQVYGGTSCAAPMWAAWAALADAKLGHKLGNANPTLYQVGKGANAAKAFHDITTGSNGTFRAGAGYDQTTGWGSYDGAGLAAALAG
ncbi:MAG: S8/S53 family peptidase [Kutzneria sp.]|nr:S8/S53 family peptidase [Kutzneria sp.]